MMEPLVNRRAEDNMCIRLLKWIWSWLLFTVVVLRSCFLHLVIRPLRAALNHCWQYLWTLIFNSQRADIQNRRFYTVNGRCLNADNELVKELKAKGRTEVTSLDQCDFILAFCPISTRAGIDIQETLEMCPGDKPVILVVLHHTHDREKSVSTQRVVPSHLVTDKLALTVVCLFFDGKLLNCNHNREEIKKVIDHRP
ncbi:unnamed protein product [Lota lota]